jgi:hypothetical protein
MFDVRTYPAQARILIVGRSFWDVAEARAFQLAVGAAFDELADLRDLRVVADLSEHALQSSAVSEVNAQTAELIKAAPIDRYAVVASQALLRLQARRLLAGIDFRLFEHRAEAADWIDWPLDDLDREIGASRH